MKTRVEIAQNLKMALDRSMHMTQSEAHDRRGIAIEQAIADLEAVDREQVSGEPRGVRAMTIDVTKPSLFGDQRRNALARNALTTIQESIEATRKNESAIADISPQLRHEWVLVTPDMQIQIANALAEDA